MRRWQEFGFAGQFTSQIPVIIDHSSTDWSIYPPAFVSFPKKAVTLENLNYCLGAGLGDAWSVYATFWQFDFANWVAPAGDCTAQHLPVGAVIFPAAAGQLRLFDALFGGFPPYPPLSQYTTPLLDITTTKPLNDLNG